jgi:hypothetical protein
MLILPIYFDCPICGQHVETVVEDGSRVGCGCITVDYDGRRLGGVDNIIPHPGEILPKQKRGEAVDIEDIQQETAFRWGQMVNRLKQPNQSI